MSRDITIRCVADNTTFETNTQICSRSNFLKNLFEEYSQEKTIDLPDIKGPIMSLVLEWLNHHKTEEPKVPPTPLRVYDLVELVGQWEDDYMNKVYNNNYESIFAFLTAVNFLDIPALLDLGSAKVACLVKDLTPEEFGKLFKIEADCTDDDIKLIEDEVLKEREERREAERIKLEEEEKLQEEQEEKDRIEKEKKLEK